MTRSRPRSAAITGRLRRPTAPPVWACARFAARSASFAIPARIRFGTTTPVSRASIAAAGATPTRRRSKRIPLVPSDRLWGHSLAAATRQTSRRLRRAAAGTESKGPPNGVPSLRSLEELEPVNLSVDLAPRAKRSLVLANPVMTASGTFSNGLEYAHLIDIDRLGAITSKGTTLLPRRGNPQPRTAETPAGMLNSIGFQNI